MPTRNPHRPTLRRLIPPRKRAYLDRLAQRDPQARLSGLLDLLEDIVDRLDEPHTVEAIRALLNVAREHPDLYVDRSANTILDDIEFAAKLFHYAGVDQEAFFYEYPAHAEHLSHAPSYLV